MSEQYFERTPACDSSPTDCTFEYRGCAVTLTTDAGVFSRGEVDYGTKALLNALPELSGRVLDLGCGYGAVGVSIGKRYPLDVTMSDVNLRALSLAEKNARRNGVAAKTVESDGFSNLTGSFDYILTNPPIRAGKQVIYRLFSEAAAHLADEGALYIVIRKQQGAQSAIAYLQTLFASVAAIEKKGGFWVLECKECKGGKNND